MRTLLLALLTLTAGCISSTTGSDAAAPLDMPASDDSGAGATCKDGIRNGDETDVDCGGAICSACAAGKHCIVAADCQSGHCLDNACFAPGGEVGPLADFAVPPVEDMATTPLVDLSLIPMSQDMATPPDMAVPLDMGPIACTFDDPNSQFDDCVVGP